MGVYYYIFLFNKQQYLANNLQEIQYDDYDEETLFRLIRALLPKGTTRPLEDLTIGDITTFEEITRVAGNRAMKLAETEEFIFNMFCSTLRTGMPGLYTFGQSELGGAGLGDFIQKFFDKKIAAMVDEETIRIPILEGKSVPAFLDEMRRLAREIKAGKHQNSQEPSPEQLDYIADCFNTWLKTLDESYAAGYSDYLIFVREDEF